MNQTITVVIDKAYGREIIRPHDELSKRYAVLLGQASFTREDIAKLKACNVTVNVHHKETTL